MKKIILCILGLLLICTYAFSQNFETGAEYCSYKKSNSPNLIDLLSPNSPKHSYDVLDYKLNLDIYNCFKSPYPKTFSGSNEIKFKVDSTLNSITLNAVNTSLAIDSIRLIGGPLLNFSHTNNILSITLDRTYVPNEIVRVKIYYRHIATSNDGAFYTYQGVVFTDCEPEGARKWFPCWDKPSDKATVDITVKVPSNARLGSNGRLNDSTVIADTIYYHWISRDPVATYLVVLTGKVNYNMDIVYWHKISNPADSIPIRFYYNTGESYQTAKNIILTMTTYYSELFGEHPFEKNGFTAIPNGAGFSWGGMENQTLTTLCSSCWTESIVSHEFAHQWFGDMITCATWADIWINEGFASFIEAIWLERTGGYTAYKNKINSFASNYLSNNPGWAISDPSWAVNTPSTNVLFNYAVTYCKGACVLHLLRYILGDTVFFNTIKSYALDTVNFKYQSTTIGDFNAKVNQVTGGNYDWFFNAWIYQPNHPIYANTYNIANVGSNVWRVNFVAKQTQTNAGFFPMILPIKVSFSTGPDTLIKVMNSVNNQMYTFFFNRQPVSVEFDPDNMIVLKTATLTVNYNEISSEIPLDYKLYQNEPNPFNPVTIITFEIPKDEFVKLNIYDINGRLVKILVNEFRNAGKYYEVFSGSKFASGIYFYRLETSSFTETKRMILVK